MRLYKGLSMAGAVATAMAVMTPPLDAQAPSERTRPPSIGGQAGPARRGSAFDAIGIHGFSIVLVVGDMQAASTANDTVPAAAKKALADMRDFLPYKSYRLLDAAWMVCCGASFGGVSGRVRGPEEQDYSYALTTSGVSDSKITVHFSLRETPAAAAGAGSSAAVTALSDTARADYSRQLYEASKERDDFDRQAQELRRKSQVGIAPKEEYQAAQQRRERAEERMQELGRMLGQVRPESLRASVGNRGIMDSTFSIAVGETVVIGTSRLKGEKALIALLTAAGKPTPSR